MFASFEHVASPTHRLHLVFFAAIREPLEDEDPSDRLPDVESQLVWLRALGFDDVDCYWKWLEMALLIGVKPAEAALAAVPVADDMFAEGDHCRRVITFEEDR